LLDELRSQYEAVPETANDRADVENFEAIVRGCARRFAGWNKRSPTSTA
jgi:hypothetical protein